MQLDKICEQVGRLAKDVGAFIREEGQHFDKDKIDYKEFNNLVSYVDVESEKKLAEGLKTILPESGILAEEGTKENLDKAYYWIIDPLDGTTNFSHGIPTFSVSIALAKEKELLLGVVYEVNRDELFSAWHSGGAWLNGKKITVSPANSLGDALIGTGFPYYMFENTDAYMNILKAFMKGTHGLRRIGSAAVDLCYVACGRFEGFFEFNLQPWDVAAGIVIVREAGGTVTDFDGKNAKPLGAEIVAAGPVHEEMVKLIGKYWN